jgi:hypothetical protein
MGVADGIVLEETHTFYLLRLLKEKGVCRSKETTVKKYGRLLLYSLYDVCIFRTEKHARFVVCVPYEMISYVFCFAYMYIYVTVQIFKLCKC